MNDRKTFKTMDAHTLHMYFDLAVRNILHKNRVPVTENSEVSYVVKSEDFDKILAEAEDKLLKEFVVLWKHSEKAKKLQGMINDS